MDEPTLYIIDAASLIVLARHRPTRRYHKIWQRLDELIRNERLISPEDVLVELKAGSDWLVEWAKRYKKEKRLFVRTNHATASVAKQLLSKFPNLIDSERLISQADPFVIALALSESRTGLLSQPCTVVTEEKFTFTGNPRIPNVCGYYKMPYLTIHQMFLREGWSF